MEQYGTQLNDEDYRRLVDATLAVYPGINLDSAVVQEKVKAQGVGRFFQKFAPELAETAELLSRLEKRGQAL